MKKVDVVLKVLCRLKGTNFLIRRSYFGIFSDASLMVAPRMSITPIYKGGMAKDELFHKFPKEFAHASKTALKISLGLESHALVKRLIRESISDSKKWALVGGPPCQAYSLVGRSRMMGTDGFENDERHTLYLEYLKIIVDHRPPIFVMENVKGLLSAHIGGKSAIDRIVADLRSPSLINNSRVEGLAYNLYSLADSTQTGEETDPRQFLLRAEEYGIPQARHRMFIVGVRSDIKVRPGLLCEVLLQPLKRR